MLASQESKQMTSVAGEHASSTNSQQPPQRSGFLVSETALKGPVFSMALSSAFNMAFVGHHNGLVAGVPFPFSGDQDTAAGEELEMAAHNGVVRQLVAWEDGKKLFSCSSDGSVKCWRLPDCSWQMSYEGHSSPVCCLAVDGKKGHLYSGDEDGLLKVWEVATGQCMQTTRCHVGPVTCIVLPTVPPPNPDATDQEIEPPLPNTILTGSSDTLVKLLEPATKLVHVLMRAEAPVCCLHYHHPVVMAGCSDGKIRGFHIHTASPVCLFIGHTDGINSLLSCRGRLISTSDDMTISLWNIRTWSSDLVLKGHERCVSAAALAKSDSRLLTVGFDGVLRVWDIEAAMMHLEASGLSSSAPATKKKKGEGKKKKK